MEVSSAVRLAFLLLILRRISLLCRSRLIGLFSPIHLSSAPFPVTRCHVHYPFDCPVSFFSIHTSLSDREKFLQHHCTLIHASTKNSRPRSRTVCLHNATRFLYPSTMSLQRKRSIGIPIFDMSVFDSTSTSRKP